MKLVMTLLCRDAADILDAQLAFHLNAGVDFVIATDHRSEDGTTEILEQYEREGHLHLIREESEQFEQSRWVTRMARLAATDFGASWVLNSDSDEFWWPRGADLKDVLAAIPDRYGLDPRSLADVPSPSRRRTVLRRAHDGAARAGRADQRSHDAVAAERQGHPSRAPAGRRSQGESQRGRSTAATPPRLVSRRGSALPVALSGARDAKGDPLLPGDDVPRPGARS